MSSGHRVLKKSFETQLLVNNRKVQLNHFVQETLANVMVGFLKSLRELEEPPKSIELKITRLVKPVDVDAHKYP